MPYQVETTTTTTSSADPLPSLSPSVGLVLVSRMTGWLGGLGGVASYLKHLLPPPAPPLPVQGFQS
jgi:hypothetical protein